MQRDDRVRLQHMLDAAREVKYFVNLEATFMGASADVSVYYSGL